LKFASLGSGSKGNGTVITSGETCVLVDCGFTIKETESRLLRLNIQPQQLTAILVTHEHSDHISGVGPFARKHKLPVHSTAGTFLSGKFGDLPEHNFVNPHQSFQLQDITVRPVPVPHDAKEPVQYVFVSEGKTLGVLTDLGSVSRHVVQQYSNLDALVLECNHCPELLANGPYPPSLKYRVGGDLGHLSNQQAAQFLSTLTQHSEAEWQHLVLAHLSEQNNALDRVKKVLAEHLQKAQNAHFACQRDGFDWLEIV